MFLVSLFLISLKIVNVMENKFKAITAEDKSLRTNVPERRWERVPSICGIFLKKRQYFPLFPIDLVTAAVKFAEIKQQGFGAVEILAPAWGGYSYSRLDQLDYYRIVPEIDTMADFRRLVRQAHRESLAVITFENLGYTSVNSVLWQKACKGVRQEIESPEARRFL